jgi:antitoxin ParD1/3/4
LLTQGKSHHYIASMNTTIHLPLSDALSNFVNEQTVTQGYADPAEYIAALLSAEQKKKVQEKIDKLLLEGVNSGPAKPMTDAHWQALQQRVKAHAGSGGAE